MVMRGAARATPHARQELGFAHDFPLIQMS
jgi:hypothetical protein